MKTVTKIALSALVLIAVFLVVEIVRSPDKDSVQLYFFNVGQGDAELIQKGNYQILIDGGPSDSILSELGKTMPLTDNEIEILILTHAHADHLAGINLVLERYRVDKIYYSGASYTSNGYEEFLETIKNKSIVSQIPDIGESAKVFANGELTFLWPGEKYKDQTIKNLNNSTEVVRFCYFAECAVFLGDEETDEQKIMFAELDIRQINYSASILKISHHGSTNGTDQTTLDKIKPKFAVIEVGADNKYGHPHAAIIDMLNLAGIKTFRTDREGTIRFQLRQNVIEIK